MKSHIFEILRELGAIFKRYMELFHLVIYYFVIKTHRFFTIAPPKAKVTLNYKYTYPENCLPIFGASS